MLNGKFKKVQCPQCYGRKSISKNLEIKTSSHFTLKALEVHLSVYPIHNSNACNVMKGLNSPESVINFTYYLADIIDYLGTPSLLSKKGQNKKQSSLPLSFYHLEKIYLG